MSEKRDESAPRIEIDVEPTAPTAPSAARSTTPHASADWMVGFDEGRERGSTEVLDALEAALVAVGVTADVAKIIVARVRVRAERPDR